MLSLEFCSASDPRYQEIRDRHYVANKGAHGQQIHFLIWFDNELVGIISGGSAVYACAPRDDFFKINSKNRKNALNGIIDNTVFRLEKHVYGLASRCIALWRQAVSRLWEKIYEVEVYGFETFIINEDGHRNGTSYKKDGWKRAGKTAGSSKNHNEVGLTGGVEGGKGAFNRVKTIPKLTYCRWATDIHTPLLAEYKSSWKAGTKTASPEEKERAKKLQTQRAELLGTVVKENEPDLLSLPTPLQPKQKRRRGRKTKSSNIGTLSTEAALAILQAIEKDRPGSIIKAAKILLNEV